MRKVSLRLPLMLLRRSTISMSVVISVPDACLYVQILAK